MLCKSPYIIHGMPRPCRRCMPCRFNHRRMWTNRILLESQCHAESSFLTLTYDDDHLPSGGTLVPRDGELFRKSLRESWRRLTGLKLRYFFVGEYGDRSFRPHYHAAVFGLPVSASDLVRDVWKKGNILLGELTPHSAQYIAGYTVKKMTSPDDSRLQGRYPEFFRPSTKPGLGATAVPFILESLHCDAFTDYLIKHGDIPRSFTNEGKTMPIGRYMRRKIMEGLGLYDFQTGEIGKAPAHQEILRLYASELQLLRQGKENISLKEVIQDFNRQKIENLVKRSNIYQQERIL